MGKYQSLIKTGDSAGMAGYFALAIITMVLILVIVRKRKSIE